MVYPRSRLGMRWLRTVAAGCLSGWGLSGQIATVLLGVVLERLGDMLCLAIIPLQQIADGVFFASALANSRSPH